MTSTEAPITVVPATTPVLSTSPAVVPPQGSDEDRYVAVEKAIYVWNVGDLGHHWWDWSAPQIELLVSVCVAHGFKRAIVFVGSAQWDWQQYFRLNMIPHEERFVNLFAALRQAGVTPYAGFYLNDSPADLTGWERAADVVSALHHFNEAHPDSAVAGIDGDQEPTNIGDEFLSMNAAQHIRRDELKTNLTLTASLKPGWLRRRFDDSSMASLAMEDMDAGMVMAYSSKAELSIRFGDEALALAAPADKDLWVALETSQRAPASDTFWDLASNDKAEFLRLVAGMDAHYKASVHAEAYQGIVIHDYEGFFEAMYGCKAPAWTRTIVSGLYTN